MLIELSWLSRLIYLDHNSDETHQRLWHNIQAYSCEISILTRHSHKYGIYSVLKGLHSGVWSVSLSSLGLQLNGTSRAHECTVNFTISLDPPWIYLLGLYGIREPGIARVVQQRISCTKNRLHFTPCHLQEDCDLKWPHHFSFQYEQN
jgi:hypothetical protein